jgi:DNA polymerase IV (archaeal DinB-like DNA polymerase)
MIKKRIIAHIDMDYFFAQVEERENPQFKGKAVVIGADPKKGKGRGVVSTCNYRAREYGIKSGMPISRAYKLNPQAIFLPVNMKLYKKTSLSIFKIIKKNCSKMEAVSLDEAYLDLTKHTKSFKVAKKIGEKIKKEIFKKEKLTSTVGIAENKMIAKMACESVKPDGIKIVLPEDMLEFISGLKIEKIPGIGPKTKKVIEKYLNKKELKVKDARRLNKKELVELLGKRGEDFYDKFRAVDNSPIEKEKEKKSIGKEYTFQKDTRSPEKVIKVFKKLVNDVAAEIEKEKLSIKNIVVICRFEDFETHSKQTSLSEKFYDNNFLYKKSVPLLLRFLMKSSKKVRLIGFRVNIK